MTRRVLSRFLPVLREGAGLANAMARGRSLPFAVTFIVTHRCNFECSYCDIPARAGDEMSTSEFKTAIDELAQAGMARASFSGGEALLRRDTVELIQHAHRRGVMTSLNSNAWSLESRLGQLAGALDMLMVSLDGPEVEHDLLRRRRGSYARCERVIEAARGYDLPVTTITVLTDENLHVIDDVLALARKMGFWAYFQPAYRDCFSHRSGLVPALSGAALSEVAMRLERARQRGLPVGNSRGYTRRLARAPAFGSCADCAAGRYFATLMPDGTFVPCHLTANEASYPNGRQMGFARAFFRIPHPDSGPGCAISPYQEQDLIFGLDAGAIRSAVSRLARDPLRFGLR